MIGKAHSVSYGSNDLRYITGESKNKKHPELISRIHDNLMPNFLDARGVWNSFKMSLGGHDRITNSVIAFELSPANEHTKHFTREDYAQLWKDFVVAFDSLEYRNKNGKVISPKTNIAGSKYTVWLHEESKGQIRHLHGAACRVDEDGNTNNDHMIHIRAQEAAEQVAINRGWTTAREVRKKQLKRLAEQCYNIINKMDHWNWDDYVKALAKLDYEVRAKKDSNGEIVRYTVHRGHRWYKASEIGPSRSFTVSRLKSTWELFHSSSVSQDESELNAEVRNTKPQNSQQNVTPIAPHNSSIRKKVGKEAKDYTVRRPKTIPYDLEMEGKSTRVYIPEKAMDFLDDEFDYRYVSNHHELTQLAVSLFVMLTGGPAVVPPSSVGGGNNETSARDKDDDELDRMRRCAQQAVAKLGKRKKGGRGR